MLCSASESLACGCLLVDWVNRRRLVRVAVEWVPANAEGRVVEREPLGLG